MSMDLPARLLDLVRAELGPSAEAEVLVSRERAALTRFANSYIHQNVAEESVRITLRVHHDGRTAAANTTSTDDDGLRALVARVGNATRLLPPDTLWPGLAPPAAPAGDGPVDPATVDATPAARAEQVRAFVGAADGLATAGYCSTTWMTCSFLNSAGQQVVAGYTEAGFDGVARAATDTATPADGVARLAATRLADIDGAVLGARAAAKARGAVEPAYLPPGEYEVVLESTAVGDMLASLAAYCFNGKAFVERQAFAKPGTAQFDPGLSLVDDPTIGGLPFDTEGTPKRRLDLVRDGVTAAGRRPRPAWSRRGTPASAATPGDPWPRT